MLILIGSRAMDLRKDSLWRENADRDYFSTDEEATADFNTGEHVEIFYHPRLKEYHWENSVATLDELYTIKASHAYWDLKNGSWVKHMYDMTCMKDCGAQIITPLHDLLYEIWEETYGKKRADLTQDAESFFTDGVFRVYEHDSLHETVAYGDEPLFNKILTNPTGVHTSRAKFNNLTEEEKIQLVREEVYATALERVLIPDNDYRPHTARSAYSYALKALITTQSKGWFPTWIVDNYDKVRKPDIDYVKKYQKNRHLLRPATKLTKMARRISGALG